MVEAQQVFSVISTFANSLLRIQVLGLPMFQWFVLFWALAIVGWALQLMYGTKGDK